MMLTLLLAALLFPGPQGPPQQTGPLRNTFVAAAETVVDSALAVDPAATNEQFAAGLATLKQSQQTLNEMALDEREQDIVAESNNMIFALSSCHLQAQGDITRLPACKAQVDQSVRSVLVLLSRHKVNSTWQDGPPAQR